MTSRRSSPQRKAGSMNVVFRDYLDQLQKNEQSKLPGERRYVPTLREIAKEIGINEVTLSKLLSGKIRSLNLDTGGKIIQTMHRFGFDMAETDLIVFTPNSPDESK